MTEPSPRDLPASPAAAASAQPGTMPPRATVLAAHWRRDAATQRPEAHWDAEKPLPDLVIHGVI